MTILITGGTGFLGSYLTRYALTRGGQSHVVVFDRHPERGRIADVLDRVTLIEGDVGDEEAVRAAIASHGVKRIAHFAFILGSPSAGRMTPYVKVQTLGTANVFEAARIAGVKRVVFASSIAAYGRQPAPVLIEDLTPNPVDLYGASKLWAEGLARHYADRQGLDVACLRYGSAYGLGRVARGSYESGLLDAPSETHYMARIEEAARGKPVTMPRDDAMADFIYAADAAKAAFLALTADRLRSRLYNVGGVRQRVGEFTAAMRDLLPDAEIVGSQTELPGNAHPPMDGARLRSELGFAPDFTLKDGLADYLERIAVFDRHRAEQG